MTFDLGLAQCRHPEDGGTEAVLEMAEQWCAEASLRGVDILVFPESLMTRYDWINGRSLLRPSQLMGRFAAE